MAFLNKVRGGSQVCNRAVVVSVKDFDPGVELARRKGVGRDAKRLHKVLSRLGFKVKIHNDPTAQEIYSLFEAGMFFRY